MVFGETYHVLPSAHGFVDEGQASWYGRKFHGRATSNGERYDMFALTAAHRSLPLPTWLRVTNLSNDRSTIVRVNDRGPFHEDRILDLSYGAAVKLGFAEQGVASVRIEAITPDRPGAMPVPAAQTPAEPADLADASGIIWVQAGAFGDPEAARRLSATLAGVLGDEADRIRLDEAIVGLTRVRIGPFADLTEANRMQALITFADVAGVPLIVRD
jgi:rare lipoprotein A